MLKQEIKAIVELYVPSQTYSRIRLQIANEIVYFYTKRKNKAKVPLYITHPREFSMMLRTYDSIHNPDKISLRLTDFSIKMNRSTIMDYLRMFGLATDHNHGGRRYLTIRKKGTTEEEVAALEDRTVALYDNDKVHHKKGRAVRILRSEGYTTSPSTVDRIWREHNLIPASKDGNPPIESRFTNEQFQSAYEKSGQYLITLVSEMHALGIKCSRNALHDYLKRNNIHIKLGPNPDRKNAINLERTRDSIITQSVVDKWDIENPLSSCDELFIDAINSCNGNIQNARDYFCENYFQIGEKRFEHDVKRLNLGHKPKRIRRKAFSLDDVPEDFNLDNILDSLINPKEEVLVPVNSVEDLVE